MKFVILYRKIALCLMLFMFANILPAQKVIDNILENIIEENMENTEASFDDDIEELYGKIKINSMSDKEILRLPFLDVFQKNNLINYRKQWGEILSADELRLIEGFTHGTAINEIIALFDFSPQHNVERWNFGNMIRDGDCFFLGRCVYDKEFSYALDENKDTTRFNVNECKMLGKFTYNYADMLKVGVVMEKDAEEHFFHKSLKFPENIEHISGYVGYSGKNINLVVGNYKVQFGQGGFVQNSATFGSNIEKTSDMLMPYRIMPAANTNETSQLRGVAGDVMFHDFNIAFYSSYVSRDAEIHVDEKTGEPYFKSFSGQGLHVSESGLKNKGSLKELASGLNIGYSGQKFSVGLNMGYLKYNVNCRRQTKDNPFGFEGQDHFATSLNYMILLRNAYLYGESGMSKNKGFANAVGLFYKIDSQFEMEITHRYANNRFHGAMPNLLMKNHGENAMSVKSTVFLAKHLTLFTRLHVNYNTLLTKSKPLRLPEKKFDMRVKAQVNNVLQLSADGGVNKICRRDETMSVLPKGYLTDVYRCRVQCLLQQHAFLSAKVRVERTFAEEENGSMMFVETKYKPNDKTSLLARVTLFEVDGFLARIYAYENDVLYNFSSQVFTGRGYSVFLLFNQKIMDKLSLWAKVKYLNNLSRQQAKVYVTLQAICRL